MGGVHVGKDEELIRETGKPPLIQAHWGKDAFFSLTFDVDLFKRLFNPKELF